MAAHHPELVRSVGTQSRIMLQMLSLILNDTVVAVIAVLLSCQQRRRDARKALSLTFNPNSHARFEICRLRERIEAHPQRIAVMISNHALSLPGRERSERPQSGDGRFDYTTRAG